MATTIGIWIAAILTLAIYSFLYKDNPFYKFAEYTIVGASVGYILASQWHEGFIQLVWNPLRHPSGFWAVLNVIIPSILGILMLARFVPKYGWLSRIPIAFTLGAGCGMSIPVTLQTRVIKQIQGTMITINGETLTTWAGITSIIIMIGTISSIIYFFFSKEHKGVFGGFSKIGIWFLMVGFGATFGYTVMARISLFIGRVQFLLYDWLHVTPK